MLGILLWIMIIFSFVVSVRTVLKERREKLRKKILEQQET